jgi:hypothetical protein
MKAVPELPDEVVHVTDDDDARLLLTQAGLIGPIERDCPSTDGTTVAVGLHHLTHWILAIHYMGNPRPADNGFQVIAWPKSRFRKDVVFAQLREMKLDPSGAVWSKFHRDDDPSGLQ